jgi:hypothetical protein
MRLMVFLTLAIGVIILLLAAGCADVKGKMDVSDFGTSFGTSADNQKAIDWFISTYGDPRSNNDQPARFVEPLITSAIDANDLPVNKVTTFPAEGGSIYFFVIYDNFRSGDPISVKWTYLENGKVVLTGQKSAGGDFGRLIIEFPKPKTGWGIGKQQITVSGGGASADVEFAIGDALQTMPLPYNSTTDEATIAGGTGQKPGQISLHVPSAKSCSAGLMLCNGKCVDLKNEADNCGTCGTVCPVTRANSHSVCKEGVCSFACDSGYQLESRSGSEGRQCNPVHPAAPAGSAASSAGSSSDTCTAQHSGNTLGTAVSIATNNWKTCGGKCVNLATDPDNCGFCSVPCPPGVGCIANACVKPDLCNKFPCPVLTHCDTHGGVPFCDPDNPIDDIINHPGETAKKVFCLGIFC